MIVIRPFVPADIPVIVSAFATHHWPKPKSTFETYWQECSTGGRCAWMAFFENEFAGYVTLKWESPYEAFREKNIPEIMDLNVLPPYRNQGIGTALLAISEKEASTKSVVVGLGVGLYSDYGNAQKLYVSRGYVPDGRGITYDYQPVPPGDQVRVDDDLILWFVKKMA